MNTRSRTVAVAALLATLLSMPAAPTRAQLAPTRACAADVEPGAALLACVSAEDTLAHLRAFQEIAEKHGGNRAAGTAGHEASAHYVAKQLLRAGYLVQYVPFDFIRYKQLAPATFARIAPTAEAYEDKRDFEVMAFSPSGDVEAKVTAVDPALGAGNQSTAGCEAEDFAGFPAGDLALIQRGTCPFMQKAENAQAAGAAGVIIFNQGNEPTREGLFGGTLSGEARLTIPVFSAPYAFGAALIALAEPATLKMAVQTVVENDVSFNVVAETPDGDPSRVVALGAHLDGVSEGPGINDNGTGSAAILEVALRVKGVSRTNRLRFAWWSAEELGLVGSTKYVAALSEAERKRIALYLNFDMVASKNFAYGTFDGDGSRHGAPGPAGSGVIERLFLDFFTGQGTAAQETQISNRSDYAAFAEAGIPFGGTFTGAEGTKSAEEVALYGGVAGEAYDKCYHHACDTIENVSSEALEMNVDAIAHAAVSYGRSVEAVIGARGGLRGMRSLRSLPYHLDGVGEVYEE